MKDFESVILQYCEKETTDTYPIYTLRSQYRSQLYNIRAKKPVDKRQKNRYIAPDGVKFFSIKDAASTYGVTVPTIFKWCKQQLKGWKMEDINDNKNV